MKQPLDAPENDVHDEQCIPPHLPVSEVDERVSSFVRRDDCRRIEPFKHALYAYLEGGWWHFYGYGRIAHETQHLSVDEDVVRNGEVELSFLLLRYDKPGHPLLIYLPVGSRGHSGMFPEEGPETGGIRKSKRHGYVFHGFVGVAQFADNLPHRVFIYPL